MWFVDEKVLIEDISTFCSQLHRKIKWKHDVVRRVLQQSMFAIYICHQFMFKFKKVNMFFYHAPDSVTSHYDKDISLSKECDYCPASNCIRGKLQTLG